MEDVVAETTFSWFPGNRERSVIVQLARPHPDGQGAWLCPYLVQLDGVSFKTGYGPGADALDALMSSLVVLAVEVKKFRMEGAISWYGRSDGYFCLDELNVSYASDEPSGT